MDNVDIDMTVEFVVVDDISIAAVGCGLIDAQRRSG